LKKKNTQEISKKPESNGFVPVSQGPASTGYPFAPLQRTLGNQAMLRLFESGGVQAKLRVRRKLL
jgi:hypothetical protein